MTKSNLSIEAQALIHEVWKVPGHQLLGELLAPAAARRGEFTNVGWLTYNALGSIGTDRTPVVFYLANDEKAPLAADFPLNIAPRTTLN